MGMLPPQGGSRAGPAPLRPRPACGADERPASWLGERRVSLSPGRVGPADPRSAAVKYVDVGGARVSAIGLGCWQFGSKDWGYDQRYAQRTAVELVSGALDLGVNLIDTAEVYAHGVSETIVGRALEGRRDEAFLATKLLPVWPTASRIEEHCRLSALRLGVDVIDLYQVHWPNPVVPLSAQMEGMRRLQDDGMVRHVGVSNFSVRRSR